MVYLAVFALGWLAGLVTVVVLLNTMLRRVS
jgi:hypothetical protein